MFFSRVALLLAAGLVAASGVSAQEFATRLPDGDAGSAAQVAQTANVDPTTGAISYTVPLLAVSSGPLTVGLSANYASQGNLVYDKGGPIGYGWHLDVGGVVTREFRGLPDDAAGKGWLFAAAYDPDSDQDDAYRGERDAEPDLFSFRAGAYHGKFYIDRATGTARQVPRSDCEIYPTSSGRRLAPTESWSRGRVFDGFDVVTPDGTTYRYGGRGQVDGNLVQLSQLSLDYEDDSLRWAGADVLSDAEVGGIPVSYYLARVEDHLGNAVEYEYAGTYVREDNYTASVGFGVFACEELCTDASEGECRMKNEDIGGPAYALELRAIRGAHERIAVEWDDFDNHLRQRVIRKLSKDTGPAGDNVVFEYDAFTSVERVSGSAIVDADLPDRSRKPALVAIVPCGAEPIPDDPGSYPPHYRFSYNSLTGHPYALPHGEEPFVRVTQGGGRQSGTPTLELGVRYDYSDYLGYAADVNRWNGLPAAEVPCAGTTYGRDDREPVHAISELTLLRTVVTPLGREIAIDYEPHDQADYELTSEPVSVGVQVACGSGSTCYAVYECPGARSFSIPADAADASSATAYISSDADIEMTVTFTKGGISQDVTYNAAGNTDLSNTRGLKGLLRELFGDDYAGDYSYCIRTARENGDSRPGMYARLDARFTVSVIEGAGNVVLPGSRVREIAVDDGAGAATTRYTYRLAERPEQSSGFMLGYIVARNGLAGHGRPADFVVARTPHPGSVPRFYSGAYVRYTRVTEATPGRGSVTRTYNDGYDRDQVTTPGSSRFAVYDRLGGAPLEEVYRTEAGAAYRTVRYRYDRDNVGGVIEDVGYRVTSDLTGYVSTTSYDFPDVTPPRLLEVTDVEDGRTTRTTMTYADGFAMALPATVETELPDASTRRVVTVYQRDYGDEDVAEVLRDRNRVAVPFATFTYKDDKLLAGTEVELAEFPLGSGSRTAVLPARRKAFSYLTDPEDPGSLTSRSLTRVVVENKTYDAAGRPVVFRRFGDSFDTEYTYEGDLLRTERFGAAETVHTYDSRLLASVTGPDGITTTYTYDEHNRPKTQTGCDGSSVTTVYHDEGGAAAGPLAVETTTLASTAAAPQTTFATYDGYGRVVQTIAVGESTEAPTAGANGAGVIHTRTVYNDFGQVERQYQPITRTSLNVEDGRKVLDASTSARYTDYVYEESPRSRPTTQTLNNGYATTYRYGYSDESIETFGYPSAFAVGQLSRTEVTDHSNHVTAAYTDAWGNTVATRDYDDASGKYQQVTYGFDVKNQLRRVTPHEGAAGNDARVYLYSYDALGRITSKKVPGRAPENFVYDPTTGRLAARDNGYLRAAGGKYWTYLYDDYGNVVRSGLNFGTPSVQMSIADELTRTNYDYTAGTITFGKVTRTEARMIAEDNVRNRPDLRGMRGGSGWIVEETQYDPSAEPCGMSTGYLRNSTVDFGNPEAIVMKQLYNEEGLPYSIVRLYDIPGRYIQRAKYPSYGRDRRYDGELYGLRVGPSPESNLSTLGATKYNAPLRKVEYNEYGELVSELVGKSGGTWLQDVNYRYDEIGRLTAINQPTAGPTTRLLTDAEATAASAPTALTGVTPASSQTERDLFHEELRYESTTAASPFGMGHTGLIQMSRKQTRGRKPVVETYGYDGYLRLTGYESREYADDGSEYTDATAVHASGSFRYDDLHRLQYLKRADHRGTFDRLRYTYADEFGASIEAIATITDLTEDPRGHGAIGQGASIYKVNPYGDHTTDPYRGFKFTYNLFGLVSSVRNIVTGAVVRYRYAADGQLYMSTQIDGDGEIASQIHYLDDIRYDSKGFGGTGIASQVYIPNAVGAITLDDNNEATDVYYQTDHLGNVVLAYRDANADGVVDPANPRELLEESRYFPYGMKVEAYARQTKAVPFGYNGAEELVLRGDEPLHLTTFRTMATETGLWSQSDPKAEAMYGSSPYAAMGSNPISYNDPHGDALPPLLVAAIGAAVGNGLLNVGTQALNGNVTNWRQGFEYFGVGAAAGVAYVVPGGGLIAGGTIQATGNKVVQTVEGQWSPDDIDMSNPMQVASFALDVGFDFVAPAAGAKLGSTLATRAYAPIAARAAAAEAVASGGGNWVGSNGAGYLLNDALTVTTAQAAPSLTVTKALPAAGTTLSRLTKFGGDEAVTHFAKHGREMMKALGRDSYNLANYIDDANHVLRSGTYLPEMNGYVRLIGGTGAPSKFAFTGLSRTSPRTITTFGIRNAKDLARTAPSFLGY